MAANSATTWVDALLPIQSLERLITAPAIFAGFFVVLFMLERAAPLRARTRPLKERLPQNVTLTVLAFIAGSLAVRPVAFGLMDWPGLERFGLLRAMGLSPVAQFVLGFFLMDLTFYYWHWANHRIPLLWRFHNVHHLDPDLDITTSFRFHTAEILYSTGFRVLQVGLLGIAAPAYLLYEVFFTCGTMFHHSDVRIPVKIERVLNLFIVTPRMHGVHHSHVREETNSNYSVVFSFWDRFHRSIRLNVPQKDIRIGVPGYSHSEDNRLKRLVFFPFMRQRAYWRLPDGEMPERTGHEDEPQGRMRE